MRRLSIQAAAQSLLLDASASETFIVRCRTSVQSLKVAKVSPGQLYVFVVIQDSNGNHAFNWGSNVLNAMAINPAPNGKTVQCCIGDFGGVLRAISPGLWS